MPRIPLKEACARIGISPETMRRWARDGYAHVHRAPSPYDARNARVWLDESEVQRLIRGEFHAPPAQQAG